ncbi:MAG: glycosyltransferase family 2 protein [Bacteroidota bacterium]
MKVAIVILNWNGKKLLEEFLPSVVRFSSGASIYVADNNSTDQSISFLTEAYPEIKIIQNKENGGYAKGYNEALQHLTEDIFVLLNNDVEVSEGWLAPVISEFQEDSTLVAAQPKILDYKNKDYFEYAGAAGGFIDKLGYPYCRGRIFNTIEKDKGQYDDVTEIFWATGACLFVKREAFMDQNGFDEDFFAHQEEIDLCWRLRSAGGHIKYVGSSEVYHLGGGTLATSNPKKTFFNFRNTLLALVKNVKGATVWWLVFQRLVLDGLAGLQFLLQGKGGHLVAVIKAHIGFYRLLPQFIRKRKKVATTLKYYRIKSIVWNYFVVKKRNFNNH